MTGLKNHVKFKSFAERSAGVAQLVERNLAKVEVASSRLVSRSTCFSVNDNAGVAQLVERNLAKVEVASSRLVSRSRFEKKGGCESFPFFIAESLSEVVVSLSVGHFCRRGSFFLLWA